MRERTLQMPRSEKEKEEVLQAPEQRLPTAFGGGNLHTPVHRGPRAAAGGYAPSCSRKNGASHEGSMHEHREEPTKKQVFYHLWPMGKHTLEQYVKDCLQWEEPHTAAGEKYEKKKIAEMLGSQLPFLILLCQSA